LGAGWHYQGEVNLKLNLFSDSLLEKIKSFHLSLEFFMRQFHVCDYPRFRIMKQVPVDVVFCAGHYTGYGCTPCIMAVPSMLIVAPKGTVNAAIELLTPNRFSVTCRVTGMVALELAVLKANIWAGRIFLKNSTGLSLAISVSNKGNVRG
jgi:hypothetical protein